MTRIILASSSPRRVGYLRDLGVEFVAVAPDVDETIDPGVPPVEMVLRIAGAKCKRVAAEFPAGSFVIAADTMVVLDGEILGKPVDAGDAQAMLRRLSGREHQVLTGLVVGGPDGFQHASVAETNVQMQGASDLEIATYVATGEPLDKAGAYGIQGRGGQLVASIRGCFSNVAGLPICRLSQVLTDLGMYSGEPVRCGQGLDAAIDSVRQVATG